MNRAMRRELEVLSRAAKEAFDASRPEHAEGLRLLWRITFPGEAVPETLKSERWKVGGCRPVSSPRTCAVLERTPARLPQDMGWQGVDPSTDFRGAGALALQNLLFLARERPELFADLVGKRRGPRSDWEYPMAASGVNLTFMLLELTGMLGRTAPAAAREGSGSAPPLPSKPPGVAGVWALDLGLTPASPADLTSPAACLQAVASCMC